MYEINLISNVASIFMYEIFLKHDISVIVFNFYVSYFRKGKKKGVSSCFVLCTLGWRLEPAAEWLLYGRPPASRLSSIRVSLALLIGWVNPRLAHC